MNKTANRVGYITINRIERVRSQYIMMVLRDQTLFVNVGLTSG